MDGSVCFGVFVLGVGKECGACVEEGCERRGEEKKEVEREV